jgi:DNA-binding GntR family transcriptional regulator
MVPDRSTLSGMTGELPTSLTKSARVYQSLRREITTGLLSPGQQLVRRNLVKKYGVSLSIVNEALGRLVNDGLVNCPENESARVIELDERAVGNDFMLREAVERQVVRVLALEASDDTLAQLLQDARALDNWILVEGPVSSLHLEFHLKMARATGYRSLEDILHRTGVRALLTSRWLANQTRPHPVDFHEQLVKVLLLRDPIVADRKMWEHLHFGEVR